MLSLVRAKAMSPGFILIGSWAISYVAKTNDVFAKLSVKIRTSTKAVCHTDRLKLGSPMHMTATMPSISDMSLMLVAMIALAHLSRDVGGKGRFVEAG